MEGPFKIIFQDKIFDPFFNLASEEYLLEQQKKSFKTNILFIYRNDTSIVCGKNQSIWGEANLKFCRENGILLNKRVSGGGTVYHDLGNLNFSYFTPRRSEWVSNFSVFNAPIIDFLKSHNINAHSNDRNDILIDNLKISGNAQHLSGDQLISHATLLFDADLDNVSSALRHSFKNVSSAAIQSKKVPVTNIRKYGLDKSTDEFLALFIKYMQKALSGKMEYGFNKKAIEEIEKLAKAKYSKQDWIFGNSPKTTIEMDMLFENQNFELKYHLEKGKIKELEMSPKDAAFKSILEEFILGELFTFEILQKKLSKQPESNQKVLKALLNNFNI